MVVSGAGTHRHRVLRSAGRDDWADGGAEAVEALAVAGEAAPLSFERESTAVTAASLLGPLFTHLVSGDR